MSIITIGVIVEEEVAATILGSTEDPEFQQKIQKYLVNPEIIEVTNFDYYPAMGSTWNGTDFVIDEGSNISHDNSVVNTPGMSEVISFALVYDGVCIGRTRFSPSPVNNVIISALRSGPTFVDITEMLANLPESSNSGTMFLRNGQIVFQ
jgi:hypothetical protein